MKHIKLPVEYNYKIGNIKFSYFFILINLTYILYVCYYKINLKGDMMLC